MVSQPVDEDAWVELASELELDELVEPAVVDALLELPPPPVVLGTVVHASAPSARQETIGSRDIVRGG